MRISTLLSLGFFFLAACANEPGKGWARLQGTVSVEIERLGERLLADGSVETASGFAVSVDTLELSFETLRLEGEEGVGPSVEARLADPVPLLAGAELFIASEDCEHECQLTTRGMLTEATLTLSLLTASGTVRSAKATDAVERPWRLTVPLEGDALNHPIAIPVHGETFELEVAVHVHVATEIFDVVDWHAAATSATLPQASVDAVREVLLASHLEVESNVEAGDDDQAPDEPDDHGHGHAH